MSTEAGIFLRCVRPLKGPADLTVIFLFGPEGANLPPDAFLNAADYSACFFSLLPDGRYDPAPLRRRGDIIVNLISDADVGAGVLPIAEFLVDMAGLPVINDPRRVRKTSREATATCLAPLPGCHVPSVRRFVAGRAKIAGSFPLLLRLAGTHGGSDLERIDDAAAARIFIDRHIGATLYACPYIDYRSIDGFYRKYRFFFVGDAIFPYHLAIGRGWKVHHATTAMADHHWMQREEARFLADPESVFHPGQVAALEAIRAAIGLDFFGIDCAIGQDGRLVVFETNATMLVHRNNEALPYKAPAVDRILAAFNALLRQKAAGRGDHAMPDRGIRSVSIC